MKAAIVLLSALAVIVVAAADEKYTTRFDNIDVDGVISNVRLFDQYVECLEQDEDSKCPPEGKELKRVIPDALKNECAKCNEKQKEGAKKVLKHLINKKPEIWQRLKAKYDPDGTYSKKYEDKERELHE